MKRIAPLLVTVCLLTLLFTTPALAQVPSLPHAFYGAVEVNGNPAPIGAQVEARGAGVTTGIMGNPITVTEAGKYGGPGGLDPKLVVQGDIEEGTTITFYVNEVSTGQTAAWHSGETSLKDLAVTIAAPPRGGGGGGGGAADTTPPTISGISVSGITETSADISWKTNEKSDSQVEYWSSPSKLSTLDETMLISHLVHLTDLTPGTTYYFKVMSRDAADNLSVSDENTFTTLGEAPAAAFSASNLSISPSEVNIGEAVTISVSVNNTGTASGTYKVTLKIDGSVEDTKEVTLNAGASTEATFSVTKDVAGTYSVEVDGLSGSFTVREKPTAPPTTPTIPEKPTPTPWPLIGGIIAGVIVVGLLIFFLVRRRAA